MLQKFARVQDIDELYIFKNLKKKPISFISFVTAFLTGILANGFAMANGYMNGDGITYGSYYTMGAWDVSQGRWGLILFSERFVTSWFDGVSACVMLAVAAALVIKIFNIKSMSSVVCISMLLAVQTHFAQWQGSIYVLLPYSVAFLSAVICVYFCEMEGKVYRLLAVMSLTLSVSIYQAYITIAMSLFLMKVIEGILSGKTYRYLKAKILLYFGIGIMTGFIYYIGIQISLQYYNVQMTGGRGWAAAMSGHLPLFYDTRNTIKFTYKLFLQLLLMDGIISFAKVHKLVYMLLFAAAFSIVILYFKNEKKISLKIITLVLLGLLPMSIVTLRLITETVIPWSMFPAIIFVPIGILLLIERGISMIRHGKWLIKGKVGGRVLGILIRYIVTLGCLFLVFESIYINNVDYSNLKKRNEKTFAASIRLIDTIEHAIGYEKGMPVIFIGNLGDTYTNPVQEYEKTLAGYEAYIMDYLPFHGTSSHGWHTYIRTYLGVVLQVPEDYGSIYNEIANSDWIHTLEVFPDKNCTGIYNGILVVRIGEK